MLDRIGRKLTICNRTGCIMQNTYMYFPEERLSHVYGMLHKLKIETGAFSQLTRRYMQEDFNPKTPDREGVR